jgi:superfamily II DNA or RNA helicase
MCVIRGYVQLPLSHLTEDQVTSFKEALTYVSPFENKVIELYKLDETSIGLPLEWFKKNYPTVYSNATDARVAMGMDAPPKLPTSIHPSVTDPIAQEKFYNDIVDNLLEQNNVLALAPTGTGKTVVALRIAGSMCLKTLVLVHTTELRDQWIRQAKLHLGLSDDDIGIIQQDKCEIEDKSIVIGLLQTQARRDYDSSVYNSFGLVIVDECHKISTEFFADVLPRFNARYRLGLSATPKRKDGSDIVLYSHIGPIRVVADSVATPVKVLVKNYYTQRKLWGNDHQERLMCLSRDPDRNELLVAHIKDFYLHNRNILVVSHSVTHIEKLMELCREAGIPSYEMGQFTATKLAYDRNYNWKVTGKKPTTSKDRIEAKAKKIVFATDNFVREGVDEQRWDLLVEAVPFWNANQRLGRIRRYVPGKLYPKAFTLRDMKCSFSQEMYNSRLKDYLDSGAEIIPV